jgi:hypothetical protein
MKRISISILVIGLAATGPTSALASASGVKKSISTPYAKVRTFHYARASCSNDRYCRKYGASSCIRQNRGVVCSAWNYERHNGKYTCKRLVYWRGASGPPRFNGGWGCGHRGWNWGPNRR